MRDRTRKLTFASLMLALALVFLGLSLVIPALDLTLCGAASACIALTVIRSGFGFGVMDYAATVILSFFLLPDKTLAVFFALLFGPLPLIRRLFYHVRRKALRMLIQLVCANVLAVAAYSLFSWAFADVEGPWWVKAAFLCAYNVLVWLYDAALGRIEWMFLTRIGNHRNQP